MSQVSRTISVKREGSLIALPFIAITQVLLGSSLGKLGSIFLNRRCIHQSFSKQDLAKREGLITAACAFGNTVTLPLVFLNGVLPREDYSSAAGYLALYVVGWSPCLWTLGYKIITSSDKSSSKNPTDNMSMVHITDRIRRIFNPPLLGILAGILVGGTPLSHFFLPAEKKLVVTFNKNFGGILYFLYSSTESILQPIIEAATLLGSATVPLQVTVLASTLATSIVRTGYRSDHASLRDSCAKDLESEGNDFSSGKQQSISLNGDVFWVITFIRLLVMPLICFILMSLLQRRRWIPADPICTFTLLVLAAMPTAQNLVVLAQLHANTRPLAEVIANLLLGQYSVALVSLTIWVTIFLLYVGLV